jgi:hypothetical protein
MLSPYGTRPHALFVTSQGASRSPRCGAFALLSRPRAGGGRWRMRSGPDSSSGAQVQRRPRRGEQAARWPQVSTHNALKSVGNHYAGARPSTPIGAQQSLTTPRQREAFSTELHDRHESSDEPVSQLQSDAAPRTHTRLSNAQSPSTSHHFSAPTSQRTPTRVLTQHASR